MHLIGASDIHQAVPLPEASDVLAEAFMAISAGRVHTAERQSLPLSSGTALLMGATEPGRGLLAKMVNVVPSNHESGLPATMGAVMLFNEATGEPRAILDGTALTAWRTAAATACATDLLARHDSRVAMLIGCGAQAATQVLALDATRDLDEIRVASLSERESRAFVEQHDSRCRCRLVAVGAPDAALQGVDIITSATTSSTPVVSGENIPEGCHVNGIGSFRPDMREFDNALVGRARVFVESRQTAAKEAGELIAAAEQGVTGEERWNRVGEVLSNAVDGRQSREQITFYKSVGHAAFDLYLAAAVFEKVQQHSIGSQWSD